VPLLTFPVRLALLISAEETPVIVYANVPPWLVVNVMVKLPPSLTVAADLVNV
jgi:hypothetical protein